MKKQLFMLGIVLAAVCATLAWAFDAPDAKMRAAEPLPVSNQQTTVKKTSGAISKAALPEPSVGVSIGTVDVVPYLESGIDNYYFSYSPYVAQTSENTFMGFQIYNSNGDVPEKYVASLEAVQSSDAVVTIPDSIMLNDERIPVRHLNRSRYDYLGPSVIYSNVTTITMPSTIVAFQNVNFDSRLENLYMLCSVPYMWTNFNGNVYVCNKEHYASYINNNYYSSAQILPYGWDFEWITVDVEKPGEFAETYLTENDFDWSAAQYVKVTGNINTIDLNAVKNLSSLVKLDLSGTEITEIPATFLNGKRRLVEVKLPETVYSIGYQAFEDCNRLKTVEVFGVQSIGNYAFTNCSRLENMDLSAAIAIGQRAFQNCSSIGEVDLSSLEDIGYGIFQNCTSLRAVKFSPNLKSMDQYTFYRTGIESLELPEGITMVPSYAFYNCWNLSSIILPKSVSEIGQYAFSQCNSLTNVDLQKGLLIIGSCAFRECVSLEKMVIPSTVNYIGYYAFCGTAITDFTCNAVVPPRTGGTFIGDAMDMSRTFLYVPPFSKDFYRNIEYWSDFSLMRSIQDPIDYIYVDRPLTINLEEEDNAVVANNPEFCLSWVDNDVIGQLTATGEGTLSAGHLTVNSRLRSRNSYRNYTNIPTLINYADNMSAEVVNNHMSFYKGITWHFISLPYDVKVADIIPDDDTYWVIKRYDAEARASGATSATWVSLTEDDVMEAGKGYIVSVKGNADYPGLMFTSGDSDTKNNIFRSDDVTVALEEHVAEFAHNRSWNLIGNPYPAYFDMHFLNEEFTAPVTIWNGYSYVAYSPVDDDLVLTPYEAFFVQCPLDSAAITFKEGGRLHSDEGKPSYKAPTMANAEVSAEGRNVFNFNISGVDSEDRARIVLNPEAEMTYEVGRDASKFFPESDGGIQLYVMSDVLYSIDERPVADGTAMLGVSVAKDGEYTISLGGRHSAEWSVILTDNETGNVTDLTNDDYVFYAMKGEAPGRFSVQFRISETGVNAVAAEFGKDSIVTVTSASGIVVYTGRMSDMKVNAAGLYIISDGNASRKAILK